MKKLEKPKFKHKQQVEFTLTDLGKKVGEIRVVDVGGAWGFDNHTYDVFVKEDNCFYKHLREEILRKI